MTYRERREARAERLHEWADKRESKAAALHAANEPYRGDVAFNTQPGHIPERARAIARTERAFEHEIKAESMRSRADNIAAAAEHAIYSDDPDACERLVERIAQLEAERDQIKAFNAAVRKGMPITEALDLVDDKQRADYRGTAKACAYMLGKKGEFPAYHLTNLSGNINRQKKRLVQLQRAAAQS